MNSIGEALVEALEQHNVQLVFGIPGVHTIELYRGLGKSNIRHVTPRHEQGAGFMADGYARVSGKPGVAFVITGPGLTNTITAMLQARADSVPMLVVCGANVANSLGKGWGHLHEMPDQSALGKTVAAVSHRVNSSEELLPALDSAFLSFQNSRPGPALIEIPLDIAGAQFTASVKSDFSTGVLSPDASKIESAQQLLSKATSPVIVIGGGARYSGAGIQALAETLDAPVVQTTNARGVMHKHPLTVPASPCLASVRTLIEESDVVLALGTEIGQTDFDMFATGELPSMNHLIRVDCCAEQLNRHPATLPIHSDVTSALSALNNAMAETRDSKDTKNTISGETRANTARHGAWNELGKDLQHISTLLTHIQQIVPNALMVGDSTQPMYAGNLYYDHDRAGGWFNAATGFGALGYGIPAAIGAALAAPGEQVICITGDGGAQFSMAEIMTAVDEKLPIIFLIWNNRGYQEIATSMQAVNIDVVGCDPTPPDFKGIAKAFGIPYIRSSDDSSDITNALNNACDIDGPTLIDVQVPNLSHIVT